MRKRENTYRHTEGHNPFCKVERHQQPGASVIVAIAECRYGYGSVSAAEASLCWVRFLADL